MVCLSPQTVQALLDGALDHAHRVEALAHATNCAECGPKVSPLKASDVLGPCQVLKPLGPGTFGLRFVARDTRNDGRIELESIRVGKLWESVAVRHRFLVTQSSPGLAKVVDVFNERGVGAVERELDEGPLFADWLAQHPRPASEVVSAWVEIGRALGVAQATGVTHGALSLDSVRFDASGRPKLSGFGACGPMDVPPEGTTPSNRSDQFGFAASLLRALTPSTPSEVRLAERFGVIRSRLPRRAVQALERALASAPERRFDNWSDLLEALRPSGLPRVFAAVAALAVGVVVIGAYAATRPAPCASANEPLDEVWNDARRLQLKQAFFRSKDPWATAAFDRSIAALNTWARNWSDQSKRLCLAAQDPKSQASPVKYADQQACLDGQAQTLEALLTEVTDSDDAALERTPVLWELLEEPRACEKPPPAPSSADQKLRHKLTAFEAALLTGRAAATREAADSVVPTVRESASVPLASDAARIYGQAFAQTGQLRDAVRWLEDARALGNALPSRTGLAAAEEALALLQSKDGDLDAARSALGAAEAASNNDPSDAVLASRTQLVHALLHLRDGNVGEARAAAEAMGAAFEKALRPAHAAVAWQTLAHAALDAHHTAEARLWQISSCRAWLRVVGEDHPQLARCRLEWSERSLQRGDAADALNAIEPAVKARLSLWKVPNAEAVKLFLTHTRALSALDRHTEAVAVASRARAEANELNPTIDAIARVLPVLALEHAKNGQLELGEAEATSALGAAQAAKQPVAPVALVLARVYLLMSRPAEALGMVTTLDATAIPKGDLLGVKGAAELGLKKNAEALKTLEEAVAADEAAAREVQGELLDAENLTLLARAQLATNDPTRADATAQRALEQLVLLPDARLSAWAHLVRATALKTLKRPELMKEERAAAEQTMHRVPAAFGNELLPVMNALDHP
ncbi:MAG: hypothetical protein QM723_22760 [Myxococcaceae bacterium]